MSMKLVFHAIIPLPFWEWDDKSRIFMRFGHSKLGHWEVNCGEFKTRYDYHEVSQKCSHYVQSWFPKYSIILYGVLHDQMPSSQIVRAAIMLKDRLQRCTHAMHSWHSSDILAKLWTKLC